MQQLRSGQTLDEQIVQMCNAMAKSNLGNLITLCAAFIRPYVSAATFPQSRFLGLSWAPHFISPPGNYLIEFLLEQTEFPHRDFQHAVATASVTSTGSFSLSCYILKGRLLPLLQHAKQCSKGSTFFNWKVGCYACLDLHQSDIFVLEIVHGHALCLNASSAHTPTANSELSFVPERTVSLAEYHVAENYFEGCMILDIEANGMGWGTLPDTVEYNVWLLLLGTIQKRLPFTDMNRLVLVFMVCVGESRENLHKIGIVQLLPTYTEVEGRSILHFDSFQNLDCTIGEFRTRDWKTWIRKQCSTSRHWAFT
ncbi:hypothetical protein L7F22_036453 [Adiantum nelumboides]|nr:hypothetical protein [Adiantum nelumboides]